jgi:hypothetical protein
LTIDSLWLIIDELMKKETVFAILLGIGAGVLIALWVIRGTQLNSSSGSQLAIDGKVTPTISISTSVVEPLLISGPDDGSLASSDTIEIKGKAKKGSLLVVQSPVQEVAQKQDADEFTIKIKLMEGANSILITSYDQKNIETRPLTIYYVDEK